MGTVLGGGDEPYTMDFGGRLREAFMVKHLTTEERRKQVAAFDTWWAIYRRLPWWMPQRVPNAICWPWSRRMKRFEALAESRGGPAPAWDADLKIRHTFGSPAG